MAKAKNTQATGATRVRVLIDCQIGKADTVVELSGDELANAIAVGFVDPDPAAVAYAETLAKG